MVLQCDYYILLWLSRVEVTCAVVFLLSDDICNCSINKWKAVSVENKKLPYKKRKLPENNESGILAKMKKIYNQYL